MSPEVGLLAAVGLVVVYTVLAIDTLNSGKGSDIQTVLRLNSFKMCPDHLDVPSSFDNLSLYMDPENEHVFYVDGILNIREDIPFGTNLVLDVRRCYNEREVSCEKYVSQEFDDVCSFLPQKDRMWTEFVNNLEGFGQSCPMRVGSYQVNEAVVNMSEYKNHTELQGHWQVEVQFLYEKIIYGCMLIDSTILLKGGVF